jgi:hypothetical protein
MGEERKVYRVFVEKPKGKRPLERPRHRWTQNGSWGDWLGGGSRFIWLRIRTSGRLL